MKKTVILKLGGSVITRKNSPKPYVRKKLLGEIALHLREVLQKNTDTRIILLHGAGSVGHQIAHKYNLSEGVLGDEKKLRGSLEIRRKNQILNARIFSIFLENKLNIVPVHTGSSILSKDASIASIFYDIIDRAFLNNTIPLLYGEMTFDSTLGMSVCSGDEIAAHLSRHYQAERVIFASDVDGIFSKDPYRYPDAKKIGVISIQNLLNHNEISLSDSHSIDVTGGIRNKVDSFRKFSSSSIRDVIVFNGLETKNFKKILDNDPPGTKILFS